MGVVIGWLYRSSLKRGAKGGHWAWYIMALGAWVLRRDRERRSAAVVSFPIKPGERVLVTMRDLEPGADS
jgi:hypothetical protein